MNKESIIYIYGYYYEENDYKKCSYSIYINNNNIHNISNIMNVKPLTKRRACFIALKELFILLKKINLNNIICYINSKYCIKKLLNNSIENNDLFNTLYDEYIIHKDKIRFISITPKLLLNKNIKDGYYASKKLAVMRTIEIESNALIIDSNIKNYNEKNKISVIDISNNKKIKKRKKKIKINTE
jgi:hypothetical protein